MDDVVADLRAYYDQDAHVRSERELYGMRVELREMFLGRLGPTPQRVLEVGCGPGKDATAFVAAGHRHVGVDLSAVHARYTLEAGAPALQASLLSLPVATASVDAAWSMSTYMHVPTDMIDAAVAELCRVVRPGGLIGIGTWGGTGVEAVLDGDRFDPPRFFALRTHAHVRSLYERHGEIDHWETGPPGSDGWEYQFAVFRPLSGPRFGRP
ncbi:MAG: class I SAM-dependent methyltransferase [Actinomycetota bacterium]